MGNCLVILDLRIFALMLNIIAGMASFQSHTWVRKKEVDYLVIVSSLFTLLFRSLYLLDQERSYLNTGGIRLYRKNQFGNGQLHMVSGQSLLGHSTGGKKNLDIDLRLLFCLSLGSEYSLSTMGYRF